MKKERNESEKGSEFERIFACPKGTLRLELSVNEIRATAIITIERMRVWIERNTWEIPCPPAAVQSPCRPSTTTDLQPFPSPPTRSLPFARSTSLQRNPFHNTPLSSHLLINGARNDRSTVHVNRNRSHPPPTNPQEAARRISTTRITRYSNVFVEVVIKAERRSGKREVACDRRTIERNEPTM